jgi:hypothetical protein
MLSSFHYGCMIAIFPECPFVLFSVVEFLCSSTGNKLHSFRNRLVSIIESEQVDVIGGNCVIEDIETVTLFGFKQQSHPSLPILGDYQ